MTAIAEGPGHSFCFAVCLFLIGLVTHGLKADTGLSAAMAAADRSESETSKPVPDETEVLKAQRVFASPIAGLEEIGTLRPRTAKEIVDSRVAVGFECPYTSDFIAKGGGRGIDFFCVHPYSTAPEHLMHWDAKIEIWNGESGYCYWFPKKHWLYWNDEELCSAGAPAKWLLRRFLIDRRAANPRSIPVSPSLTGRWSSPRARTSLSDLTSTRYEIDCCQTVLSDRCFAAGWCRFLRELSDRPQAGRGSADHPPLRLAARL